ncbi:MAG: 50S ribosomal protein L10 [Deltaproteobacteria bacterium]|nr:50S ribosomal protein L10 [Deltaproteobacteria bacterium]
MNAADKNASIDSLKTRLASAQSLVLADFRGVTVESDNKLRREFRAVGCEYQVVKNTLLGKAVKGTPMEILEPLLAGPTAIAFSVEDPSAPAKVATKVARAESKFVIKGGFLDGKLLDQKGVEALSSLPGKAEARATFLATLLAASQDFLRLLAAASQNFVYLLCAREDALEGGEQK